jgi:uncharacterized protein YabE (DUF348 family)
MGVVPTPETHEESLSDMSYAWRWARANKKMLLSVFTAFAASMLLFTLLVYGTHAKRVWIEADGSKVEIITTKDTVNGVLQEQGILIGEHDVVSLPVTAEVKQGTTIAIERAFPVRITADGKTLEIYTTAGDVTDALHKAGIKLGQLDKIQPAPEVQLLAATEIQIVRVNRVVEKQEHPLPYETVKREDGSILKGREQVVQQGKKGLLIKEIEKIFEDGTLVSEQIVARQVKTDSRDHIIAIGTKSPPKKTLNSVAVLNAKTQEITLQGMTFDVKGILNNVKLTAYTAGLESTGKSKNHPRYGYTATGTKVSEGRTISVDPDVIPLGWWVYIDGIGFRRAEDTGGAVNGNKIDVYFESLSHALKFGVKRGYTVYIIGPHKPIIQ